MPSRVPRISFIIQTGVLIEHPLSKQIVNLDLGFQRRHVHGLSWYTIPILVDTVCPSRIVPQLQNRRCGHYDRPVAGSNGEGRAGLGRA